MKVDSQDNIKRQTINDVDLSPDIISTQVTLRENGISDCIMHANNDQGKLYLSNIQLYDTIKVTYWYEDDNNPVVVFRGIAIELQPNLTKSGEILSVTAHGMGYPLKQMRVSSEYGQLPPIPQTQLTVASFVSPREGEGDAGDVWQVTGAEPWINTIDPYGGGINSYIYATANATNIASSDRFLKSFGFPTLPIKWLGVTFTEAKLIAWGFKSGSNDVVNVRSYLSTDNGITWHSLDNFVFDSVSTQEVDIDISSYIHTYTDLFFCQVYLELSGHSPSDGSGLIEIYKMAIEVASEGTEYNTVRQLIAGPTNNSGNGIVPDYVNKIGIEIPAMPYGYGYTAPDSGYDINTDYVYSDTTKIPYVRFPYQDAMQCLQDIMKLAMAARYQQIGSSAAGLHWIVDNDSHLLVAPIGNHNVGAILSKYSLIDDASENTNYVLVSNSDGVNLSIGDVVIVGDDLNSQTTYVSYKTVEDTSTNIVVGNELSHNYTMANHAYIAKTNNISSIWPDRPLLNPIVVRQDMITQSFKTELPLANYVLVSGKYVRPLSDLWSTMIASGWESGGLMTLTPDNWYPLSSDSLVQLSYDPKYFVEGTQSIKIHHTTFDVEDCQVGVYVGKLLQNQDESQIFTPTGIDLTKLIGKDTYVTISFWFMRGGWVQSPNLRLYTINTGRTTDSSKPGKMIQPDSYLEFDFDAPNPMQWYKIEAKLEQKDIDLLVGNNNIQLTAAMSSVKTKWSLGTNGEAAFDFTKVNFIGIDIGTTTIPNTQIADCWIDGLCIVGTCIRGAKDSTNISTYGCRTLTIKDSLAYTDSLGVDDDTSPLAQDALYELLRHRVVRTSGEITIPLTPVLQAGQIVHIQANMLEDGTYKIDREFRITEVRHTFDKRGATTSLKLVDDLINSITVNTQDPYTILMRAVNPDYQSRTFASLKTGTDFDYSIVPIVKDYPS